MSQCPAWARPENAHFLVPGLLAGKWNEAREGDQSAIAELAGTEYAAADRLLVQLRSQPDSPVRRIGETWVLAAPLDAWSLLSRYITSPDLQRYQETVRRVLGEIDPWSESTPEERILGELRDEGPRYSPVLRQGLADGMALLAVVADMAGLNAAPRGSDFVQGLVSSLLGKQAGQKRWIALSDLLPSLAEASPEAFLEKLEADLDESSPDALSLFATSDSLFGANYRHHSLLWALERLAWYREYVSPVALALAKLARIAPPVKIVNQPAKSLREILCTWHRNTEISLEERFQIIDTLVRREPRQAWELLLELMPKSHDVSMGIAEPRWRSKPDIGPMTYAEAWQAKTLVVRKGLEVAGLDGKLLCSLVPHAALWAPEEREILLDQIKKFSATSEDNAIRTELWNKLREVVGFHRTYPCTADPVLTRDLAQMEVAMESLEPADFLEPYLHLFEDELPRLMHPKATSVEGKPEIEDRLREAEQARRDAVSTIFRALGLDGLRALACRSKKSWRVGWAAAEVEEISESERKLIDRTLAAEDSQVRNAGLAYVTRRCQVKGADWSERFRQSTLFQQWSAEKQAEFCLGLPVGRATWQIVSSLGSAAEAKYWSKLRVFLGGLDRNEDAEHAIARLVDSGRAVDAMEQAGSHPEKLKSSTLIRVLDAASKQLSEDRVASPSQMFGYDLGRILDRLQVSGEAPIEELGRLEWQFLPVLQGAPSNLCKRLSCFVTFHPW